MGKNSSLISVIVPVYNVEQYLDQCILSIVSQTYSNLDIILIDDGSTDRSMDICRDWEKKDSRVRVFHQENQGQGPARNWGVVLAKGDWIFFVDSDDYLEKNAISLLYAQTDIQYDIVVGGYQIVDTDTDKILEVVLPEMFNEISTEIERKRFIRRWTAAPWAKLYRKKIFSMADVNQPKGPGQDAAVFPIFVHLSKKIKCVEACVYNYRKNRPNNIQSSILKHKFMYQILDKFCSYFKEAHCFDTYQDTLLFYSTKHLFYWLEKMKTVLSVDEFKIIKKKFMDGLELHFGEGCLERQITSLQIGSFNIRWISNNLRHVGANDAHVPFLTTISQFYNEKKVTKQFYHPNAFRNHCIQVDCEKGFYHAYSQKYADIILIDFINDCQPVICFENDSIISCSEAYMEIEQDSENDGCILEYNTKQYRDMWKQSCINLIRLLNEQQKDIPVYLIQSRYVEKYKKGEKLIVFPNLDDINSKNKWIEEMEQFFLENSDRKIHIMPFPSKYAYSGEISEGRNSVNYTMCKNAIIEVAEQILEQEFEINRRKENISE